jgi:hypothetical protein
VGPIPKFASAFAARCARTSGSGPQDDIQQSKAIIYFMGGGWVTHH